MLLPFHSPMATLSLRRACTTRPLASTHALKLRRLPRCRIDSAARRAVVRMNTACSNELKLRRSPTASNVASARERRRDRYAAGAAMSHHVEKARRSPARIVPLVARIMI